MSSFNMVGQFLKLVKNFENLHFSWIFAFLNHFCSDSTPEKFKKFSTDFTKKSIILNFDAQAPVHPVEMFLGALSAELCYFENHFGRNRTEAKRAENARSVRITLWAGPNLGLPTCPASHSRPGSSSVGRAGTHLRASKPTTHFLGFYSTNPSVPTGKSGNYSLGRA